MTSTSHFLIGKEEFCQSRFKHSVEEKMVVKFTLQYENLQKCELCPSKYGALKRTDNSGWAHVVCALYIPEIRFGNVTTMEPIQLQLIPSERFNKVCLFYCFILI